MARWWRDATRRNPVWRSYRVALLLFRTLYVINRERTRVIRARQRGDYEARPNLDVLIRVLRDFRLTAIELGGLLIKLGQFLGARADLLPREALAELASLHDEVPAERFEDIKGALERAWGVPAGEVCATIEPEPAGSASLGQVHRATLRDGREVAIKVQRPGIDAIVRTDLRTLRFVLRVVARLAPAANRITDLGALFREFSRTVAEELDYEHEAENAERFAAMFEDEPNIRVPGVIAEHSTRRVLVLEWMDGIKITDVAALDAAGVDRDELAIQVARAYFKQVLDDGFFHADPHPGNILVQPQAGTPTVVFLDFGMMGEVTPRMRSGLRDCITGVVARDPATVVRGLDKLGFLSPTANRDAIERLVGAMLARFGALAGGGRRRRDVDPREVYGDMETALYDQPFRLPANLAFFGRMAGMVLGLTAALSPRFNFVAVATPYARQYMASGGLGGILRLFGVESTGELGRDLAQGAVATMRSLASVPRRLDRVLERAEQGELHIVVESPDGRPSGGPRRGRRERAPALLNRPVPLWVPVGIVGAMAAARLARTRIGANGSHDERAVVLTWPRLGTNRSANSRGSQRHRPGVRLPGRHAKGRTR